MTLIKAVHGTSRKGLYEIIQVFIQNLHKKGAADEMSLALSASNPRQARFVLQNASLAGLLKLHRNRSARHQQPHIPIFSSPFCILAVCHLASPELTMPPRSSTAAVLQPIRNVVSASALYPFKGIWYFCANREFWPLFGRRLIPLVATSIIVLGILFTFAYLPQVAFLAIFHGPVAWFNAAVLVLGEGQVVIALLFEALLVDETLVNVFDVRLPSL